MPELAKQLSAEAVAPRSAPPFAGPLFRISAYAIDLVLVWFVGYSLHMSMKPQLLMLGPFLPFLSWFSFWVYFFVTNSALGGGRSFGKALLNIRTTDSAGAPLSTGRAALRASVQCPFVVPAAWQLFADFAPSGNLFIYFTGELLRFASRAVMLTHLYCVFTSPRNQGWHDMIAGSFVTRDPVPDEFAEALAEHTEEEWRERLRPQFLISRWFCIAIFIVMAVLFRGSFSSERRTRLRMISEIERTHPVPGFRLFDLIVGTLQERPAAGGPADGPVAVSISSDPAGGGKELLVALIYIKQFGPIIPAPEPDEPVRRELDRLRGEFPSLRHLHPALAAENAYTTETLSVTLTPRLSSYDAALGQGRFWNVHGPLDPARAALEYDWIDIKREEERRQAEERAAGDTAAGDKAAVERARGAAPGAVLPEAAVQEAAGQAEAR